MFCTNCGEKLPENAAVCPNCGAPVPGKELKNDTIDTAETVTTEKITIESSSADNPAAISAEENASMKDPLESKITEPEVIESEIIEPEVTEKIVIENNPSETVTTTEKIEVKSDKVSEIIPELHPEQEPKITDVKVTPVAGSIEGESLEKKATSESMSIEDKVAQAEKSSTLNNPHGTPIQDLPKRESVEHRDTAQTPFDNVSRSAAPAAASNKFDFLWALLGFLFPLIGAILYFFWRTKKPSAAKWALIGAAAAIILRFITNLLGIGAGLGGYGLFGPF